MRELPRADGSAGLRARELRAIGTLAHDRRRGTPIDASGALPDGSRVRRAWPGCGRCSWPQREQFVATVTEKLLTYALGRGVEYYDQPGGPQIVRDAAADDYRWSSIISASSRARRFRCGGRES